MRFWSVTRVIVVLAATAASAQIANPGTTTGAPVLNRQKMGPRRGPAANKTADPQGLVAMRERVEDMGNTLSQMRVVLKQMHARAAKSKPTDPATKANIDMWELMVGHLDKELEQMRVTLAAREDMEVRRAALYKQADAKAEAAARAAQAARFAEAQQNATGASAPVAPQQATGQGAQQSPTPQAAPAQPSAPPTSSTASPN